MDIKQAKIANPLNFYKSPLDVDKDLELSKDDKIKILLNWQDDIYLRQIAEAENMPNFESTGYHLSEIETLLRKYQKMV